MLNTSNCECFNLLQLTVYPQFYFMDNEADTEPRKFFSFDGCIIKMDKDMLEIEVLNLVKTSFQTQFDAVLDTD
jgi:hypothetical protein